MSDEPTTDSVTVGAAALRDGRWLAGGIWTALLLALITTSGYGIKAFSEGSISARYFGLPSGDNLDTNARVTSILGIVLSAATALLILAGWRAFARVTNILIAALAESSDEPEEAPVPADWLLTDARGVVFSNAGEVVQFVGFAWAVMVVTPALLAIPISFA